MQGQLREESLSVRITTECAHCGRPLHMEIDSELTYRVTEAGAAPLFFAPLNAITPGMPSIIDGF